MKCSSNGIPTPDISWEMNGVKINSSSHMELSSETPKDGSVESTIIISKIAVEDGGLYSCTATNRGGKSHHSARVNVYGMRNSCY